MPKQPRAATDSSIGHRRKQAQSDSRATYVERRRQLLQAAGTVFKKKGLQGASINDVAAEFGSDRASVYYYYGSKEEIFLELVREVVEELVLIAEAISASQDPAGARLAGIIEALFDSYERHYPYQHLYVQEDLSRVGAGAGADVAVLGERFMAALNAVAVEGIESGQFRKDVDPQLLSLAVIGSVNWSHRWFKPGGRLTGSEIGRSVADLYLSGVTNAGPAGRSPATLRTTSRKPRVRATPGSDG